MTKVPQTKAISAGFYHVPNNLKQTGKPTNLRVFGSKKIKGLKQDSKKSSKSIIYRYYSFQIFLIYPNFCS